jgi:hypothetical protein
MDSRGCGYNARTPIATSRRPAASANQIQIGRTFTLSNTSRDRRCAGVDPPANVIHDDVSFALSSVQSAAPRPERSRVLNERCTGWRETKIVGGESNDRWIDLDEIGHNSHSALSSGPPRGPNVWPTLKTSSRTAGTAASDSPARIVTKLRRRELGARSQPTLRSSPQPTTRESQRATPTKRTGHAEHRRNDARADDLDHHHGRPRYMRVPLKTKTPETVVVPGASGLVGPVRCGGWI